MFRIDLPHLCWALENLVDRKVVNEIRVDPHTASGRRSRWSECWRSRERATRWASSSRLAIPWIDHFSTSTIGLGLKTDAVRLDL
jgi:hypothetical protein